MAEEPKSPKYFQDRAVEASAQAALLADPVSRVAVLQVASDYEALAASLERLKKMLSGVEPDALKQQPAPDKPNR